LKNFPEYFIERFREELLSVPINPEGAELLDKMQSMKIKSFVKYDDKIKQMTKNLLITGRL